MPLRFGPYRMPRFKIGGNTHAPHRGHQRRSVTVASRGGRGHRIPILCGSLVRVVKRESASDVAEAWGGRGLVSKWRKALRVKGTEGDRLRLSEAVRASDPARPRKISKARRGKSRPRHVIEAMATARTGMKHSPETRAKMSETHRRIGTWPPAAKRPMGRKTK